MPYNEENDRGQAISDTIKGNHTYSPSMRFLIVPFDILICIQSFNKMVCHDLYRMDLISTNVKISS